MNALLRAEARKFVTTRSFLGLAVATIGYPGLTLLGLAVAPDAPTLGEHAWAEILRGGADLLPLVALILGILAVAGEFRHGTIVPTLLATPRRAQFVWAKVGAQAATGAVLAVATSAVALAAGAAYLAATDVSVDATAGEIALAAGGVVLVASSFAVIGAALGALVRNQTAAIAGALLWVLAVENVIPTILGHAGLSRWLPGGSADRLLHLSNPAANAASPWLAVAVLLGTTAALAVAAVARIKRADVN